MNIFKLFVFCGLVAMSLCGTTVSAQNSGELNKKFGLGIILGEPTGISGKYWTGTRTAIDGAVAWSTGTHSDVNLHFDYLMHNFNVLNVSEKNLILYYGIGTRFEFTNDNNKDTKVGVRVPLGITYLFPTAPFDVFLEVIPVLDLIPDSEFGINAGLGVRYYFR